MSKKRLVHPKFKKLVREAAMAARYEASRDDYRIDTCYVAEDKNVEGTDRAYADISISVRYLAATMTVYPYLENEWKRGALTDEEVGEVIFHEVAHLLTEPMKRLIERPFKTMEEMCDTWESATEQVGRIMWNAHRLREQGRSKKKSVKRLSPTKKKVKGR